MLNLINFSLPVLIYFLSNLLILFLLNYYFFNNIPNRKVSTVYKLLCIIIIFTILLQVLYNQKFKVTVWLLVLSPLIFIVSLIFLYIFIIIRIKGRFEIKSLFTLYKITKTMIQLKINSFNFIKINNSMK